MSSDSNNAAHDPSQDPDEGLLDEEMEEEPANRSITPPNTGDSKQPKATRANPRGNPPRDKLLPGRDGGRGVPGAGKGGPGAGRGGPGAGRGRRGRGRRHGP